MRAAESQSRAFSESTSCCRIAMRRSRSSAAAIADWECHLVCGHYAHLRRGYAHKKHD